KYYRQVDPTGSGRVAAADAALFLKRSGLADLVLGKIWDLADSERKGCLNKQQFFIALRLVACAQNGLEVALKSLNLAVPPPKFHDTSSPLLPGGVAIDIPWVVKAEEKMKFDAIFDSLGPVGGMLTGEKVKPVLLNSKLPVDVLGRVWELSDLDRDGMLDKDEFAVAMYLVYRALEGEPVPMSLPPPLVPPSKRKKSSWVVSPADKAKYDELFSKTDGDMDGLVSGPEVRDIFLKTGLPSATLARIWELCDIGDIGKLTREQFALALHLINQKLTKGLDPPQTLSPEMIPPSDRHNIKQVSHPADFSAIKELDSLSNEIVDLQREKSGVEQEIKEKEEAIQQRTSEVQDLQDEVAREGTELQRLQSERQRVQEALEELDEQRNTLEEQLAHIRQQTSHENQLISSLQLEHEEQEQRISQYEEELVQAREELLNLQEETRRLEEKVQAAQEQLTPLQESVRDSYTQVAQVSLHVSSENTWCLHPIRFPCCADFSQTDYGISFIDDPFKDDPFGKADAADPFGGDPFKGTDPFAADSFFKQSSGAPFPSENLFNASADPFGTTPGAAEPDLFAAKLNNTATAAASGADPFTSKTTSTGSATKDPFSSTGDSTSNGADAFGTNNKNLFHDDSQPASPDVPPALPPKTGTPTRPPPPPPGQLFVCLSLCVCTLLSCLSAYVCASMVCVCVCVCLCVHSVFMEQYPTEEDMIEWAKRESEREEKERLARLTQQEQEDLELAIALSKSELS
uniref:Epidermal growth factor receptor pathway substrate 15 n=1 Tax=Myripristis murdjan TaxID=586833 RepID=A0A667WTL7_9TELE